MIAAPGGGLAAGRPRTASLRRRMACFAYEATLLFGLALIPGALGAFFYAQTGQHHPLQSETALRVYALVLYGVYFVTLWSRRGQTLAMQTWRIRVVTTAGERLSQGRALGRFVAACCAWFAPATIAAATLHWPPARSLGAVATGIAGYALLALLEPDRQFWHDRLCGTRLIDVGPANARARDTEAGNDAPRDGGAGDAPSRDAPGSAASAARPRPR
jgi:uncharacterized RDD family membrane protein YckC